MRLRRHALAGGLAIALLAAVPAAWGSTASEYARIRARYHPTRFERVAVLEDNLEHFMDQCVEFRGEITGRMRSGQRDLLLLKAGDGGVHIAVSNTTPQMAVGNAVRVIVRPPEDRSDLTYTLVAIAWEAEIARLDPKPAAPRQPAEPPRWGGRALRSRGGYSGPRVYHAGPSQPAYMGPEIVAAYANMIRRFNKRLTAGQAATIAQAIIDFSAHYGLDARLVMAVVAVESNFNPYATSRSGAMGLGQLMPATARGMGVGNAYDYRQNLDGAVRLIRGHLANNSGDLTLALACYNAGSGAVRRAGGVPPIAETHNYIRKVVSLFLAFAPEYLNGRR